MSPLKAGSAVAVSSPTPGMDSQLAQQGAQRYDEGGSLAHPARGQAVQRREHLLGYGVDRNRPDVLVAAGLEDALGTSMQAESLEESIPSLKLTKPRVLELRSSTQCSAGRESSSRSMSAGVVTLAPGAHVVWLRRAALVHIDASAGVLWYLAFVHSGAGVLVLWTLRCVVCL